MNTTANTAKNDDNISNIKIPGVGIINWESEDTGFDINDDSSEFNTLLQEREGSSEIKEGSIVAGTVTVITDDIVRIDIGHKTEGEVPKSEFLSFEGELKISSGDQVEVYLDSFEDNNGEMILSREKAEMLRAWDRIADAFENEESVEGTIMARVKGGLSVDIGVKAFLPGSQVELRPVRNLDKLINSKFSFKIIKFNKKRGNIVLSRRALLENDRAKMRKTTLEKLKVDAELKGVVKNITEYGAFIDLGGIDGLLHITDMSWGRINHPSQIFEVAQELNVKVLSYDEEKQRVSLGYKQLQKDPWIDENFSYKVGNKTKGKIVSLTDYGAFVELEEGIEGLIHISEMTWSKRIKHPSKVVDIDQEVDVEVLAIDSNARRISLGMKQLEENPWVTVKNTYRVGDVIKGRIRNITDFGIFVGVQEDIDGLIHISDISWTERVAHPNDKYQKDEEVEAKVLQISVEDEKFSLGIKQLEEDPFIKVAKELVPATKGKGKVTKVTNLAVFVELSKGVEGIIHKNELDPSNKNVDPQEVVKEGEEIEFVVLSTDMEQRRITLSKSAHTKGLEGDVLKTYMEKVVSEYQSKSAFADAFAQAKEDDLNKKNNKDKK